MILAQADDRKTLASTTVNLCKHMNLELFVYHALQRRCSYWELIWPSHACTRTSLGRRGGTMFMSGGKKTLLFPLPFNGTVEVFLSNPHSNRQGLDNDGTF